MRWAAQVLHVARKDVRLARWPMLAYLGLLLVATLVATGWVEVPGRELGLLLPLLLAAFALTVLAQVVQADSPARADAYWATLPLSHSAVFVAKLLLAALLLLALPALGQVAGFAALRAAPGDYPSLLFGALASQGGWMAVALLLAAITPDLRGFLLALVLVFLALVGMQNFLAFSLLDRGVEAAPSMSAALAVRLLALGLAAHVYVTRRVGRGRVLAALLLPLAIAEPFLPLRAAAAPSLSDAPHASRLRAAELELHSDRSTVRFVLEGAPDSLRYVLRTHAAEIQMSDGSRVAATEFTFGSLALNEWRPRLPGVERWLGAQAPLPDGATRTWQLFPTQRRADTHDATVLALRGAVEGWRPQPLLELPLEAGAEGVAHGTRVRVLEAGSPGGTLRLRLHVTALSRPSRSSARASLDREHHYVLVHAARREAVALQVGQGNGGLSWLVLPGASAQTEEIELRTPLPWGGPLEPVDAAWLAGAHLHVLGWKHVGSDPVDARFEVRATDAPSER